MRQPTWPTPAPLDPDPQSVADPDDTDDEPVIFDLVQNPVVPLPQAVAFLAGEFLCSRGSRIVRQGPDRRQDAEDILLRDAPDVLGYRLADDKPIACHRASAP